MAIARIFKDYEALMIDPAGGSAPGAAPGNIFKMVHNPRMAGGVPAWVKTESAEDGIIRGLAAAGTGPSFKDALSYRMQEPEKTKNSEFGFFDLIDIINPLQHIPVVNFIYRHLTGDEIKSPAQIIGGALFGGPAGAAGGLVNVIVQEETGKDIGGNAFALLSGETPHWAKHLSGNPEKRLGDVLAGKAPDDLPVSLLAFTDRGIAKVSRPEQKITEYFSPYEIY